MSPIPSGNNSGVLKKTTPPQSGRVLPTHPTPVRIVSASVALTVLTIVYDQPVVLKGTPQYTTDVAGASPVSAASPNPTTVDITFDIAVTAATVVTIPYLDPAIRSKRGGYVADSTFTI